MSSLQNYNDSIENLLNNQNWCNCPEIVKLTISKLYDNINFLNNKISNFECQIINRKIDDCNCSNNTLDNVNCQIDNLIRDINRKLNCYATMNDIEKINKILNSKVNICDLNNILTSKADKDDVINILRTKCDKVDFDVQMKKKIDVTEYNELINLLNNKVNCSDIEQINLCLANKIDKCNFNSIIDNINNKLDTKEFNSFIECEYNKFIENNNKKIKDIDDDFDRLIRNIKSQFNNINCVISKMENDKIGKVTYDELLKQLKGKIDKKEFLGTFNQFQFDINEKMNDIKNNNDKSFKENEDNFNIKLNDISSCLNKKIECLNCEIENLNCENKNNIIHIQENIRNLEDIGNKISFIQSENESKFCHLYELLKTKLEINDYKEDINLLEKNLKEKIKLGLEEKSTYKDLELLYKNIQTNLNEKLTSFEDNTQKNLNDFNNTLNILSKEKLNLVDLNPLLKDKFDYLEDLIQSKFKEKTIDEIDTEIRKLNLQIQQKLDKEKYYDDQIKNKNLIDNISNTILNYYTKNEIVDLLKPKSDIGEINKIVNKLNEKINEKVSINTFNPFLELQNSINNLYLNDNSFGRWIWKSGKLKSGKIIPFENQYSNTFSDNFLWEKDKGSIMISKGGFYNIIIGIFNKGKKAVIHVLVNGENIITKNEDNYILGCERKNFNFDVSSITVNQFIFIPDKTRISIIYECDDNQSLSGFLELRALQYYNRNEDSSGRDRLCWPVDSDFAGTEERCDGSGCDCGESGTDQPATLSDSGRVYRAVSDGEGPSAAGHARW